MSARLKLVIAYDGASLAGWQSQIHGNTIQDQLEKAFRCVAGTKVRIHGAGRTDAGVHALAQCAHADLPDRARSAARWQIALNAKLPPTIRILRCRYVRADFHARFSAKGKMYRYRIWAAPILPPWEIARAWHVKAPLDLATMRNCAQLFLGRHDFRGFAANRGKPESSSVRTIQTVRTKQNGPLITIEFEGDGFLYKMVRLMVGSIVRCGAGKIQSKAIHQQLSVPHKRGMRFVAPAEGLFLVRIQY